MQKFLLFITGLLFIGCTSKLNDDNLPAGFSWNLLIKNAGNPAATYHLTAKRSGKGYRLYSDDILPVDLFLTVRVNENKILLNLTIEAKRNIDLNFSGSYFPVDIVPANTEFLLPGFWYHLNQRSPENAPGIKKGASWMVREDRLSTPMAGVFDSTQKVAFVIFRNDKVNQDVLLPYEYGEVLLGSETELGGIGFIREKESVGLLFSYPFIEKPYTYRHKLTLLPSLTAFNRMQAGEKKQVSWEIMRINASSYSEFVEKAWSIGFDHFRPEPISVTLSDDSVKHILSEYFRESFSECGNLRSSSGVELHIDSCERRGIFEIGFVGRVLMNAFNALQYGYEKNDSLMVIQARSVFESYDKFGFNNAGLLREWIDCRTGREADIFSLRRQSEGVSALVHFLAYEKENNRMHDGLERKTFHLVKCLQALQRPDGSFPRKFDAQFRIRDFSSGSSSTVIPAMILASSYFKDTSMFNTACKAACFLDREIVAKADYFSSTLDANCEDKEAALYALNSYYYLWLASDSDAKPHYLEQARKVSFFALSWYYLWDVPFAPGQMLGDLGFKTKGWGNVSVENNHVDVYAFEFPEVLKWLSEQTGDVRYSRMADLILSSMKEQLLPRPGHLCGIAKPGYHPEVVQHTNWDYGKNGKGYYNDIFAPGWVVCSLWEMLTPGRSKEIIQQNLLHR